MGRIEDLKKKAKTLQKEIFALYLAYRDPRVPWYAKLLIICVVGYAFSPIDLIPDFIPILGYLDDLILLPLGIFLSIKMIPPQVLAEYREKADILMKKGKPKNWVAAGIIIFLWSLICLWIVIQFIPKY